MMGMGMGVGFSSPPPWTPAAIPGAQLWLGTPGLTYAAQPVNVDWGMELAGTANWTAWSGSTIAKDATVSHGGTQSLKCSHNVNNAGARRVTVPVGNRQRITGWARGDGGLNPVVSCDGMLSDWIGTTAATWQAITAEGTMGVNGTAFFVQGAAVAGSVWFDDLTVVNLSLSKLTPAFLAPAYAGTWLAQATATAQPWWGQYGMTCQAGDNTLWTAPKAASKCCHDGTGATINICVRASALAAENRIFATADSAVGNVGVVLYYTNANTVGIRVMNGGAAFDIDTAAACNVAINTTYVFTLKIAAGANGVEVLCDNVSKLTATLTAPSAADPTTGLMIGASAAGSASSLDGAVRDFHFANRVLSAAENAQLVADMKLRCP